MLLFNLSPIYLRCGLLLIKSNSISKEINSFKDKFQYIRPEMSIDYKTRLLLLFQISYFKISEFKKSPDFEFLFDKIKLVKNFSSGDQEDLQLMKHKDSITPLEEPRNKSAKTPICYYCGHITGKKEMIIYETFQKKCIKFGHVNQLTIAGIDYVNNNLNKTFFNLPEQSVHNLVNVGKGIEKVTQKNSISLKDNLYPYLLTNGHEGLSVYRVDSINSFTRLGGNTLGATTLWSLLTLACGYEDPDLAVSEATKGNNQLIDLSVGDIYGGNYDKMSLGSDLIASSFGKLKYVEDINKVEKKDVARSLVVLYGATFSQVTAMLSTGQKIDKVIISANPFYSLELMQMIQTCSSMFSGGSINAIFNEYSDYFEIIGMCTELDKCGLLGIKNDDEYSGII